MYFICQTLYLPKTGNQTNSVNISHNNRLNKDKINDLLNIATETRSIQPIIVMDRFVIWVGIKPKSSIRCSLPIFHGGTQPNRLYIHISADASDSKWSLISRDFAIQTCFSICLQNNAMRCANKGGFSHRCLSLPPPASRLPPKNRLPMMTKNKFD